MGKSRLYFVRFFQFFCFIRHFFDTIEVILVVKVRGFVVIFGKAETDTLSSGIISTKFVMQLGLCNYFEKQGSSLDMSRTM